MFEHYQYEVMRWLEPGSDGQEGGFVNVPGMKTDHMRKVGVYFSAFSVCFAADSFHLDVFGLLWQARLIKTADGDHLVC